jgi:hypothetical protein
MRKCRASTGKFFIVLILAQFIPVAASQPRARQGVTEDLSGGASFTFDIGPNLPQFTFKVVPEPQTTDQYGNAQSTVRDIQVFRGDSKQPLQHLTGCVFRNMQPPRAESDWFHTEDFNFDGYQDVFLGTWWGATGNAGGCIWLYNPRSGRFDYNPELTALDIRSLDPQTKTILCFETGGMAGMVHSAERYKVENNGPVLIWSERQDWDSSRNQFHCVQQERHGDKLATILNIRGTEDDVRQCVASRLFDN